jgi:2'-5' RNA ligase
MTILRSKGRTVNTSYISSKYQGRTFGSDWVDKVHLKKSELRTSGSIYSNVLTVEAKK